MHLERITESNISFAVSIQEELFPGESARANYEESVDGSSGFEYYLIYEGDECAGIIGLYSCPVDPESAWLGWFGVREGFRRRHIGSAALKRFEEMAEAGGYRYARLYTDAVNNDAAIAFYRANGYISEPYLNPEDPACLKYKTLIFSKPLADGPLIPWNSRNIGLTGQIEKQRKYSKHIFITLRDRPELKNRAAAWFHEKWRVPEQAYLDCMTAYLDRETEYGWYLCLEGERIVGGLGVIENDFHDRKDLSPNVCAVYTEEDCRCRGIAGRLLNMAVEDMRAKGITPLYLLTDHTGFYERYGWEFFCMAQGDGETKLSRMYIHR